jgi:hypothetical protein
MSNNPFSNPASASGIQWEDHLGKLLLVEPTAFESAVKTSLGERDAVRADITVIDADGDGPEELRDTLIFPRVLISQTRSLIGEKVLGRLAQGEAKPGQNPPWKLLEATDADIETGVRYLETRKPKNANPFASASKSDIPF